MAYLTYYSNVQDILDDSGIQPVTMGYEDMDDLTAEDQLENKIESWLIEAKSYIDSTCNRDFSADIQNGVIKDIPICIHSIAKRVTITLVNSATLNRKSPVIKVNDFSVKQVTTNPMTPDIIADLDRCLSLIDVEEEPTEDPSFTFSALI
jgi:hypothetical protein